MRLEDWRQGGERRVRRTGIIPGVMIQQFDRERERDGGRERERRSRSEKKQGRRAGREGKREGGWRSDA